MLLTLERLSAATLEQWGLINEVVEADVLLPRAMELAAHISRFDAIALAEVKKTLDHIPAEIRDWRRAMEYGQSVNATIRRRRSEQLPP
jgi:enoyl-CoA hydratase/carnithine racemase